MDDQLERIAQRARDGDPDAMNDLLILGRRHLNNNQPRQAAEALLEAVFAYRYHCNQTKGRQGRILKSLIQEGLIYRLWVEQNPHGLRELPREAPEIDEECIRRIVVEQLLHEAAFSEIFDYVWNSVSEKAVPGSVARVVINFLHVVFGLNLTRQYEHLLENTIGVRVAIELIADEVEKRCHQARQEPIQEGSA